MSCYIIILSSLVEINLKNVFINKIFEDVRIIEASEQHKRPFWNGFVMLKGDMYMAEFCTDRYVDIIYILKDNLFKSRYRP